MRLKAVCGCVKGGGWLWSGGYGGVTVENKQRRTWHGRPGKRERECVENISLSRLLHLSNPTILTPFKPKTTIIQREWERDKEQCVCERESKWDIFSMYSRMKMKMMMMEAWVGDDLRKWCIFSGYFFSPVGCWLKLIFVLILLFQYFHCCFMRE